MSNKIQFPNNRLTPPALGKPVFATDIQNNTENLLEAMNILLGLPASGGTAFAILSGLTYNESEGTYDPGYVYMNGVIYYSADIIYDPCYLVPNVTDTESKLHNPDGNSYNTYRIYYAISSSSPSGGMPQFTGSMDQYRLSIVLAKSQAIATAAADATSKANTAQSNAEEYTDNAISGLGTAATKDVGLAANNVLQSDGMSRDKFTMTSDQYDKLVTVEDDFVCRRATGMKQPKIIEITNYNMNTGGAVSEISIAHGLTYSKIIGCRVIIENDEETLKNVISGTNGNGSSTACYYEVNGTNIRIINEIGSTYCSSSYDGTGHRGWIIIDNIA